MIADAAEIVIAPAGEADLLALARLRVQLAAVHGGQLTVEAARERLAGNLRHSYRVTAFRAGEAIVGYALWLDLGDHVFLRQFVLDEALRGRGLGRELFERLAAEAFPPRREIRLDVLHGGPAGFWTALGFAAKTTGMRRAPDPEEA